MAFEHIRNLVFEGGSVKGIAYLGGLKVLQERDILKNAVRFCGSSAGAITAWLMCYSTDDLSKIETILRKTELSKFADDDAGILRDSSRLLNRYGWHKGETFYDWTQEITHDRCGKEHVSFTELYEKTGHELVMTGCKRLSEKSLCGQSPSESGGTKAPEAALSAAIRRCRATPGTPLAAGRRPEWACQTASNISKGKTALFSRDRTPDLYVERALRISMSIPSYFRAIFLRDRSTHAAGNMLGNPGINKDNDKARDVFVDGGVFDNYPIQKLFDVKPYVENPVDGEVIESISGRTPSQYNKSPLGFRLDTPTELGIGHLGKDSD